MFGIMCKLVEGDIFVDIIGVDCKDEIGDMVEIVVVFKDNVIEKVVLEVR